MNKLKMQNFKYFKKIFQATQRLYSYNNFDEIFHGQISKQVTFIRSPALLQPSSTSAQ